MTTHAELYGDIDEFDLGYDGISAVVPLHDKGESGNREGLSWERAEYPHHLIPEHGRYSLANLKVTVSTAANPQGVEWTVGTDESVAEFEAEVFEVDIDRPVFWLRDIDDGTRVGEMELQPDHLPDWFRAVGDRAYVTVGMEYLHNRTVDVVAERTGRTEEDLIRQREGAKEMFEEWEEEYL